jgi:hypothetical protein
MMSSRSIAACILILALAITGGCGSDSKSKDPAKTPAFLTVTSKLTASVAGMPSIVEAIEVESSDCQVSPARIESITLRGKESTVLNFVMADKGCGFALRSLSLASESNGTAVKFIPVTNARVTGEAQKVSVRLVSEDETKSLSADISTTYAENFERAADLVMLFGYESSTRALGSELRRVDNDEAVSLGATTGDAGVGLRIDTMVARKAPDNSSIIALEVRFSCVRIRVGNTCLDWDLTEYEFVFIPGQSDLPKSAEMAAAFSDAARVNAVTSENIFGNGVYALIATPERLPVTNLPPAKLWLLVRTGALISGFEVSTSGLIIF